MSNLSVEIQKELCPPISEWPVWAEWFAVDKRGATYFYKYEPDALDDVWRSSLGQYEMYKVVGFRYDWKQMLWSRADAEKLHYSDTIVMPRSIENLRPHLEGEFFVKDEHDNFNEIPLDTIENIYKRIVELVESEATDE